MQTVLVSEIRMLRCKAADLYQRIISVRETLTTLTSAQIPIKQHSNFRWWQKIGNNRAAALFLVAAVVFCFDSAESLAGDRRRRSFASLRWLCCLFIQALPARPYSLHPSHKPLQHVLLLPHAQPFLLRKPHRLFIQMRDPRDVPFRAWQYWNGDGVLRGRALLRKIRLGVMEKELKVRGVWAAVSKQELERATACAAE